MKLDRKDIMLCFGFILIGIIMVLLIVFIYNKAYEYNCDHIPITEAWKDQKCRAYFERSMGD